MRHHLLSYLVYRLYSHLMQRMNKAEQFGKVQVFNTLAIWKFEVLTASAPEIEPPF